MRSAAKTIAAMTPTPPESTMSQSPQKHAQKVFLCLVLQFLKQQREFRKGNAHAAHNVHDLAVFRLQLFLLQLLEQIGRASCRERV